MKIALNLPTSRDSRNGTDPIGAIRFSIFFLLVAVVTITQYACISKGMDEQINQLIQEKDYRGAADAYQSIIDSKPGTSEARQAQLGIAKLYIDRMNQPEQGVKVYQDLLTAAPDSDEAPEAHWQLGLRAFKAEDYESAQQSFDTIVNKFPGSERSHNAQLMLAKSYEEASNYEKAAEVYDNVANRHPEGKRATQALVNKARIEQEYLNNQAAAQETYQSLVKEYGAREGTEESVEEAKKALQLMGAHIPKPDEPDAQDLSTEFNRRLNYRDRRRAEREAAGFESSPATGLPSDFPDSGLGVNPEEVMEPYKQTIMQESAGAEGLEPEVYHDTVLKIALLKLQFQEYRDAAVLFFYAIELAKRENARIDPYSFLRLSVCYRKIGMYQRAAAVLREAVRRDINVLEAVVVTGDNQYLDEEYERAIETYSSILGLNRSRDPEIYWRLGLVYQKMGNYEKEAEFCERAIASKTDYVDALQSLAYVLDRHLKDKQRARIFADLATGQGNSYEGEIELGAICYKYGNYTWAKTKYKAAAGLVKRQKKASTPPAEKLILDNRIIYAQVHAAMAFYRAEMADNAQEIFDTIATEYPDHALRHYGNAQMALLKGEPDTAIAEFQASMEKDPTLHHAAIALGEYYISQGNTDETEALWSGFLKRNHRNRLVRQRLGKLKAQLEAETNSD